MNLLNRLVLVVALFLPMGSAFAQESETETTSPDGIWQLAPPPSGESGARPDPLITASRFETFQLNPEALDGMLSKAPPEAELAARDQPYTLSLPTPDGGYETFNLGESTIMEPALARWMEENGYPMRTFKGYSLENPDRVARLDWGGPAGFHGMVSSSERTYFIDPAYRDQPDTYMSYDKKDFNNRDKRFTCDVKGKPRPVSRAASGTAAARASGIRIYRTVVAATGEYARFQDAASPADAKVDAQAAIISTINRVNQIYERELSLRLVLAGNNNTVVFTDPDTDPYENGNSLQMLSKNQELLTRVIGADRFDLGHVFGLNSGGSANLAVTCKGFAKARGMTGSSRPVGDPFDVDYVAHEMGHQLGANHTFNTATAGSCNSANRNPPTAYEPGSGSTIMGYAGICAPDNLQTNSDPYFHGGSLDEILFHLSGAGACYNTVASGNNAAPTVDAGPNRVIPANTPFLLNAMDGSDADGDRLTYAWEEFDLGAATSLSAPDNGSSPLIRSLPPSADSRRAIPSLEDLSRGALSRGVKLPTTDRTMNFRVTVRDNHPGGGLLGEDFITVTATTQAGPFRITAPNGGELFNVATTPNIQVTWNPANTQTAPVSVDQVSIRLSTDGGLTFPRELLAATPNDGSASAPLPAGVSTGQARIMVMANGNIFFDVSDANFAIVAGTPPNCRTPNKTLPNGGTITDDLNLAGSRVIGDLNLTLDADLNRIGDLIVTLTHVNSGVSVVVLDRPGVPAGPFGCLNGSVTATLDDEAASPVESACTTGAAGSIGGTHAPNNPLSAFDGKDAGGPWRLTLRDASGAQTPGITSVLKSWCVQGSEQGSEPPKFKLSTATDGAGMGRVTASSGGLACPGTCSVDYTQGARVELTAAAAQGSRFTGWRGACSGASATCEVLMSAARGVTATFQPANEDGFCSSAAATLNSPGSISSDLRVDAAGALSDLDLALNITHSWVGDLLVELKHLDTGTSAMLLDRPGLPGAQDGCGNDNIVATLDDEGGAAAENTCNAAAPALGGRLRPNQPLSVFDGEGLAGAWRLIVSDASADDGGTLMQWCLQGTTGQPQTKHLLNVATVGAGTGRIASDTGGISCPGGCSAEFLQGAEVRLTATAGAGSFFTGWSGACPQLQNPCTLTMSQARNTTATFNREDPNGKLLSVITGGRGKGAITDNSGNLSCPGRCNVTYPNGTPVQLTATPDKNSRFQGWSGSCSGANPVCNLNMSAMKLTTAVFEALPEETQCSADKLQIASGFSKGVHKIYSGTAIETRGNVAFIDTAEVSLKAPRITLAPGLRVIRGGQLKVQPGNVNCSALP